MAGNLFNKIDNPIPEAEAHSDPKPEIADPGTFDKEGRIVDTTENDGKAELEIDGTADTMVGVDVNAGQPNS